MFVIAGGGTGKNVYRRLQCERIPFAAGILFENDLDYPVAKALAADLLSTKGFEPVPAGLFEEAKRKISTCKQVICCKQTFGSFEKPNEDLLLFAKEQGKRVVISGE